MAWRFRLYILGDFIDHPALVKTLPSLLLATILGAGFSRAEIGTNAAPGDLHVKFGLIHGVGEAVGTGFAADGEGFMAGLEYQWSERLGLNGRYEVADFDIYQNFRLTVDGKLDLTDELSLHLAGGYQWQNVLDFLSETHGILTNVGLCWERGKWFIGANYSRVFAIDTGTNFTAGGLAFDLPEEDSDLVEIVAGYRFSDSLAITLSYEKQVGGDTVIDMKRHMILGLRLKL